jgi:hypothetical protein
MGLEALFLSPKDFTPGEVLGFTVTRGERAELHVVLYPYFIEHESDSWWQEHQGVNDFVNESLKLAYYLLRGYVSMKSLW